VPEVVLWVSDEGRNRAVAISMNVAVVSSVRKGWKLVGSG